MPPPSWAGERDAPHTSQSCFSFLACAGVLFGWRRGRSAHVKTLLFLFGVCQCSLAMAKGMLRTRQNLVFSFWRVPPPSCAGEMAAPHTSQSCFFFLTCASALLCWRNGCSAHVKTLLFLFGVCLRPLWLAKGMLRTRHFPCFFFLACTSALLCWRNGCPAHVIFLAFSFWRVPAFSCAGERDAPHTSQSCFFFLACASALSQRRLGFSAHVTILLFLFGVCLRPLGLAKGMLRTRHFTHFLKTFPINLSTTFVFIGLSSDSNVYMILSP